MIFNVSGANLVGIRGINLMFAYQSFIKKKKKIQHDTKKKEKNSSAAVSTLHLISCVSVHPS